MDILRELEVFRIISYFVNITNVYVFVDIQEKYDIDLYPFGSHCINVYSLFSIMIQKHSNPYIYHEFTSYLIV